MRRLAGNLFARLRERRDLTTPGVLGAFTLLALCYSATALMTSGREVEVMSQPGGGVSISSSMMRIEDPNATPSPRPAFSLALDCPGCETGLNVFPSPTPTPVPPTPTPLPPTPIPQPVPPFDVSARAIAIIEAPCGALIYGRDEHASLAPASLTKIVTALTAIDRVNLDEEVLVQISGKDLKRRTRSSIMGLEPGNRVSVRDLLYGLFLPSGNDAAIELAQRASGSVEAFVDQMNQKSAEVGLTESHFTNPHGLDSDGLYSSAYDMAKAGLIMMQNPVLAEISGTRSYTLPGGLSFKNGNKLLGSFPGAYGVKIGFTNDAGHTIVGSAAQGGRDIFIAVFDSKAMYPETEALLEWAFRESHPAC
jgi:D-alanyl-D-alanine carboxypeptidase